MAGSTKALVPGLVKKSKLAPLVAEQSAGAPLHGTTSNLWWQATWSAPYLPGEEGALMLLKVLGTKEADAKEAPLVGWVALPLEGMGEQHLQLHAPPLPLSAAEARAPKTDALEAWLHCDLSLGVTGAFATVADAIRADRRAAAAVAAPPPVAVGGGADFEPPPLKKRITLSFKPSLSRGKSVSGGGATPRLLQGGGGGGLKSPRGAAATPRRGSVEGKKPATPATRAAVPPTPSTPAPPPPTLSAAHHDLLTALPAVDAAPPDPELSPEGAAERRGKVVDLAQAAAAAAQSGDSELALRGYAAAFALTGSLSFLLGAANMLLLRNKLDEAAAAYGRIQAAPALTADQNSYVLAKLDELQALRDGAAQFGADVKQKRSRASTKHEGMIDAAALKEIEKI